MGESCLSQVLQAFGGRKGREEPFQRHLDRADRAKQLSALVSLFCCWRALALQWATDGWAGEDLTPLLHPRGREIISGRSQRG